MPKKQNNIHFIRILKVKMKPPFVRKNPTIRNKFFQLHLNFLWY